MQKRFDFMREYNLNNIEYLSDYIRLEIKVEAPDLQLPKWYSLLMIHLYVCHSESMSLESEQIDASVRAEKVRVSFLTPNDPEPYTE
jgi:hypothetical protein